MAKGKPRAVEKIILGHNTAGPSSSSSSSSDGFSGVPQAPVFYPTDDEFKDPLAFISKIRPLAEPFGICRIVPPKSWTPPFALHLPSFTFPTKSQSIHHLQSRPPSCDPETFHLEYNRFLDSHRKSKQRARRAIVFQGGELDLCRLFNAVKRYGGYNKVCEGKRWGDVSRFLLHSDTKISECSKHVLSQLYREHLLDYEEYRCRPVSDNATVPPKEESLPSHPKRRRKKSNGEKVNVVGLQDSDLGAENGTVPRKEQSLSSDPKRGRKNSNLEKVKEVGLQDSDCGVDNGTVPPKEHSLLSDRKRRRNNSNGEKVKEVDQQDSVRGAENGTISLKEQSLSSDPKRRRKNSNVGKVKEVGLQDSDRGADNGTVPPKEQLLSSYRKRRKKNYNGERVKEADSDQVCQQCSSGLHGEVMLLCDRCDKGWHLYCLSPPLENVPSGNWYCLNCVNSDKDSFGFVPGKRCLIEAFRRMDDRAKKKWLGHSHTTRGQIEKRFWEIVEGRVGEVEVKYGSDLDTSRYGSGFPRVDDPIPLSVEPDVWREYSSSPWNLNNLPKLQGSLLRVVHDNIAGVMVPWLYIGMLFSSFCWHIEDHCFYSINYLHWGEPKCWYGVPGIEANAFEKVMRNTLPDLFDAQPDLLFQLVTMLSPSVLQENGVSVYGVMQEPGNFVITFPRSFHAGFNFGLNCAEAVNFASADWLPHGGFGAELYRLYRKPAVLSHEELLFVVAKNGCDPKVLPYLKEEMSRIFIREKRCREDIWRNGTVRSALLPSKKQPTYVGIEEDSTCIICQQYLYLSAISCSCRPSSLVCLEHSKHLCECKPYKRCLYYRHSLAELGDLVQICSLTSGTTCDLESICSIKSHNKSSTMKKKVKGHYLTYVQLAEDWLLNSCQVLEAPYTNVSYTNALKEAEQFLWADHSMDPVRDMVTKLIEGQKWAQNIRNFLLKVDDFFRCKTNHIDKVSLWQVEELLSIEPLSCYEPGYTKLKVYAEEARHLSVEIESALSARLEIGELERLQAIAVEYPISIEESEILAKEISSAKVLMNRAFDCLSGKNNSITIDFLNKLKSEVLELRVQLPDIGSILNLCREAESWQVRSKEILAGPVKLKELEDFLLGTDNFTVSIPELEVVKQQLSDACSWISQVHKTLQNLKDREDHENIVPELSRILMAGELLRVQVDELPLVEAELRRSRCRERAFKAVSTEMPLGLIKELLTEASLLEIENEDLFIGIFTMLTTATSWEERAKFVLSHGAPLSEFEEVVRSSELITVILPSLPDVKDAVSKAQLWISRSQPYLSFDAHDGDVLRPLRKVDDLKELVTQSKLLKVTLDGSSDRLENILKDVIGWEHTAHSLLEHLKALLNMQETDLVFGNQHKTKLEELLKRIASTTEIGLSLSFELNELASLQHAILTLQWCLKGLSFSFRIPLLEEVDNFLEDADSFPPIFSGNNLAQILVRGSSCLRKALALLHELQTPKRCKLRDIEETLEEIQKILIPYPEMVAQLQNSIEKHNFWIEQVHAFFRLLGKQSWPVLLKLKELGQSVAFDCPELHKVANESEKVEQWMLQCHAVVEPLVGDLGSLLIELAKIKDMMGRALCIYCGSRGFRASTYCVCCPDESENEKVYTCLTCGDRYHFTCMGPPLANAGMTNEYACPFCLYMESGLISQGGGRTLICKGNRPDLKSFIELLSLSEDLSSDFEERTLVQEIVKQASECKTYLTKIVSKAFSPRDEDLSPISENLLCALKAIAVAGVYDEQDCCKLEAALSRNSWKIRFNKLFRQPKKPALQQIQHLLKEGLAISIPPEDHLMQEITRVKQISLQWADTAKKVSCDAGDLELSEVFKLIIEGEALPVQFEKEMKLLRERSELYCICRKPYDQRAMIACDQCDEWYHFDCINLNQPPPETFFCAACRPTNGEFISLPRPKHNEERSNTDTEPRTPPACRNEPKVRSSRKKTRDSLEKKMDASVDLANILRCNSESDHLWRESRRPLQRTARRRSDYESLSLNFSFSRISSCK